MRTASPATEAWTRTRKAEAVVLGPLGLVAENVVSFLDFLELDLSLLVAGIAVGVKLPRELAVGALDLLIRGAAFDAENIVIIAGHI